MDSSNRLSYILGKEKVAAKEIEPVEWLMLIRKQVVICKPYLKYLWGFKTIDNRLNWREGNEERRTEVMNVHLPSGITFNSRYVCLLSLVNPKKGREESKRIEAHESFLLTQNGNVLHSQETCSHRIVDATTSVPIKLIETLTAQFFLMNEQSLLSCLEEKPYIGEEMFKTICWIVAETLNEKRDRLENIRNVWLELANIKNRIKF